MVGRKVPVVENIVDGAWTISVWCNGPGRDRGVLDG